MMHAATTPTTRHTATTLKWRLLAGLMSTLGRAGEGIDLGYRHGFDSGVMLDYVYENRPAGRLLIGPLIDRVYLNAVGWRAIRARAELLTSTLRREIAAQLTQSGPVVLADVAAGPGRYLCTLCRALWVEDPQAAGNLLVICRDLDHLALERGRYRADALGLSNIRYETGDAVDPASLATLEPRPHIVVVSGLYELFVDTGPITQSMTGIYQVLRPGGRLIFTTQVAHPQLELIANVLVNREGKPWIMVCRSIAETEGLARQAGFEVVGSAIEPVGLFGVTVCRKPEG